MNFPPLVIYLKSIKHLVMNRNSNCADTGELIEILSQEALKLNWNVRPMVGVRKKSFSFFSFIYNFPIFPLLDDSCVFTIAKLLRSFSREYVCVCTTVDSANLASCDDHGRENEKYDFSSYSIVCFLFLRFQLGRITK